MGRGVDDGRGVDETNDANSCVMSVPGDTLNVDGHKDGTPAGVSGDVSMASAVVAAIAFRRR